MTIVYGASLRGEWLIEPGTVFLNHGASGAMPRAVLAAQDEVRRRIEANPPRFLGRLYSARIRAAASDLSAYVKAEADDLVFVDNATSGVNAVLRSLNFRPGDEIVVTTLGYNAVRNAVRYIASRSGAAIVEVPIPLPVTNEDEIIARVAARLSARTRLAIFDHIASHSAILMPVERLVRLAQASGAEVLVDGAHAPGQIPLDLPAIGADYYVGNCHKWLMAPRGCGFLWAKQERQGDLHPLAISHGYGKGFTAEFDWTGTRDPSAFLTVPAGIAFHENLGGEQLMARNHELVCTMAHSLADEWGAVPAAPDSMFASMATIRLPIAGPATQDRAYEIQRLLYDGHKIEVPVNCMEGAFWMRIAAQAYNEPEDYELLRSALAALR